MDMLKILKKQVLLSQQNLTDLILRKMTIDECINKLIEVNKKVSFEAMCGHLDTLPDVELKNRWKTILEEFKNS